AALDHANRRSGAPVSGHRRCPRIRRSTRNTGLAWPAPPRASAITPASFRLETGEVEEDVADAAASQPRVSEFVRAVAAWDGCGGRRGRVVDEDGVAFQADEDEQVAGRGGDGGAAELAGRVAHGGDDRNSALETPARRAPVGEAQQIAGHAARARAAVRHPPRARLGTHPRHT